ncbi:DoxX family protein [Kribbella sp. NPDC056345]|uniref:DoxX family protein n=1 Tax=Kribbella sp. NPDC056345 TaxID=3345789 RepID=UPI0035DF89AA
MSISLDTRLVRSANSTLGWLSRHNVDILRVSLGLIFFGFGLLKFFPGASPAEALVTRTVGALTFGMVDGRNAVLMTAGLECFIGLTLITGLLLRSGLLVLAVSLGGIMAPLVLFFNDLFPGGTPTIEGQYVLKDIVLAAAALVIAARAFGLDGSQYKQPSRSDLIKAA